MAAAVNKNNAYSTLAGSLTNVSSSMTVGSGHGDRFPVVTAPDWAIVTLADAAGNIEIVKVTARGNGADTMAITRAQEGTAARAWSIGDIVELRPTAGTMATVDGVQTLTQKSISGSANTLTNVPTSALSIVAAIKSFLDAATTALARAALGITTTGDAVATAASPADARTAIGAAPAGSYAASGANSDITSLAGPSLGAATATTPAGSDNSTRVATTALVRALGQAYLTGTGYSSNTTLTDYAYGQFFYLSGTMTLTLPVADASNIGRSITCHCYTTGQITVATQSSQILYYQGTNTTTGAVMMGVGDTLTFVNYNGSAWMAIGSNSMGIGQTWQGVTRNAGTTYTNTTGKPITLSVHGTPDTSNAYIIATVGGTTVGGQATASSAYGALQVVVPPGLTYSWTMSAGSLSNITCRELR